MSQSAFHYALTVQSFIKLNKVTEEAEKKINPEVTPWTELNAYLNAWLP